MGYNRSPKKNQAQLEQVTVNGKIKYIKKFDDAYYGARLYKTDKRLKQRGLIFENMLNDASKPIDDMLQHQY